jgi:hypothetical protein
MQLLPGMRRIPARYRLAYNASFAAEHFLKRSTRVRALRQAAQDRIVANVRAGGPGRTITVERRTDLGPKEFRRSYLRKGIPVVLAGEAAAWPLMTRWGFGIFREKYGDETIKLVQREGLTDDDFVFDKEYSEEIRFADFLDLVRSGGRKYMRFSPLLEQFPELMRDFDHRFFTRMIGRTIGARLGHSFQLFIGGTGTITPFHNAMTPFFFTAVDGTKRWSLIPNHYLAVLAPRADGFQYNHSEVALDLSNSDQYPGLESIEHLEAVLEPGDLLYVPSWMWHAVANESPAIGVRCGFMYLPGMIREGATLTFLRIFAGDPNVFKWLYYSYIKTDLPDRTDMLITPKWFNPDDVDDVDEVAADPKEPVPVP